MSQKNSQMEATNWFRVRQAARDFFPAPWSDSHKDPAFSKQIADAIDALLALKHSGQSGDRFCFLDGGELPNYDNTQDATVAPTPSSVSQVTETLVGLFRGLPNWNNPLTMPNVIPPANIASIIGSTMADVFSPNIIEGEYAWNAEKSELESSAMIAKLIGWEAWGPSKSSGAGGLFTFGGTGCYLYGVKYALSKVLQGSRQKGIRTDAKLIVSRQGHYVKYNCTDWAGLGTDNIIEIPTNDDNSMDMEELQKTLSDLSSKKVPVVAIVCTTGTTDAFAMDSVASVREKVNAFNQPGGLPKPLIYADSVIGWSWLFFKDYDFTANPLGFSAELLPIMKANRDAILEVAQADAMGCDFHKTGWGPYNCSLFMVKDYPDFVQLMKREGSAYLQERTAYNPGLYTLETSRSGNYSLAGYAALKLLGVQGFQALLGGILEMQHYLRSRISVEKTMVVVNNIDNGFVTLFRVYPPNVDAQSAFNAEDNDESKEVDLKNNNLLQEKVANTMWDWVRTKLLNNSVYGSYSSGFRPAHWNRDLHQKDTSSGYIYALKSFPMNPNIDTTAMDLIVKQALLARDTVVIAVLQPLVERGDLPANCLPSNPEAQAMVNSGAVNLSGEPINPNFLIQHRRSS